MSAASLPLSPTWRRLLALAALVFAIATLFKGGSVIFDPDSARASMENYVPFVVWFNFFAGFFYMAGAYAIWAARPWARALALAIALATLAVGVAFAIHAIGGGAFSLQTVGALPLRFGFWLFIAHKLSRA